VNLFTNAELKDESQVLLTYINQDGCCNFHYYWLRCAIVGPKSNPRAPVNWMGIYCYGRNSVCGRVATESPKQEAVKVRVEIGVKFLL
jgi:hypothetical protein